MNTEFDSAPATGPKAERSRAGSALNGRLTPGRAPAPSAQWPGLAVVGLCLILAACGCGGPVSADVDVSVARATLTQVLDHWKNGGSIDDLRTELPDIVVQELTWEEGAVLQEYDIVNEGRAENCNWFCDVEMTFAASGDGKVKQQTFTYVVATDPVVSVFRSMF